MIEITPFLIDIILGVVAMEFILLCALLAKVRASHLILPLFLFLVSGAFLLATIRFKLSSMGVNWEGAALLGALITHAALLYWAARSFMHRSET